MNDFENKIFNDDDYEEIRKANEVSEYLAICSEKRYKENIRTQYFKNNK